MSEPRDRDECLIVVVWEVPEVGASSDSLMTDKAWSRIAMSRSRRSVLVSVSPFDGNERRDLDDGPMEADRSTLSRL